MDPRDRARELGQGAGTKPVEEDDPREKLRDRSGRAGPFRREDLPPCACVVAERDPGMPRAES